MVAIGPLLIERLHHSPPNPKRGPKSRCPDNGHCRLPVAEQKIKHEPRKHTSAASRFNPFSRWFKPEPLTRRRPVQITAKPTPVFKDYIRVQKTGPLSQVDVEQVDGKLEVGKPIKFKTTTVPLKNAGEVYEAGYYWATVWSDGKATLHPVHTIKVSCSDPRVQQILAGALLGATH